MSTEPPNHAAEQAEGPPVVSLSPQRRWLRWAAIAAVLAFLGACGSCVGCVIVGTRAASEGATFAAETIEAVAQPWSADALVSRAAPELLQNAPAEKLPDFIRFVGRRLGPLKTAGPIQKGEWRVFMGTAGPAVFAWQFSDCQFERGPARITMQLVKRYDGWRVVTFNVNSDLLLKDEQP
jgi:hypothetical protein